MAPMLQPCLLYTSDAADERSSVDLGGRRIIKKKKETATGSVDAASANTDERVITCAFDRHETNRGVHMH